MKFTILFFIPFLAISLHAQQNEDIRKCSLINDQVERLACFDALAKNLSKSPKSEIKPPVEKLIPLLEEIPVEEEISKSSEEIIEDQKGKIVSLETKIKKITRQREVEKQINESKYQPFSAIIVSVSFTNYKYKFKLDNGETWQLTDSGKRARLKKGEEISIVPGQVSSFFLKNSKGQFRVKKLK